MAGPVTRKIFELLIVRLMVFAGRATNEILRPHFVRLVVFTGPTSNRIVVVQMVTFVVVTGPATDEFGNRCLQGLSWCLGLAGPATSEILELQTHFLGGSCCRQESVPDRLTLSLAW